MITLLTGFIVAHLGAILGGLAGVAGVVFGAFRHQQARTAESNAQATVASSAAAVAQANADAATAGEQSAKAANDAQTAAAATPDADLDAGLAKLGSLRKD